MDHDLYLFKTQSCTDLVNKPYLQMTEVEQKQNAQSRTTQFL